MNYLLTGNKGFLGSHIQAALTQQGHQVIGLDLETDITNYKSLERLSIALPKLDGIINNAAVSFKGKNTEDQFERTLLVNIKGAWNVISAFQENLNKNAAIVNVASIYGTTPPDFSIYEGNTQLLNSSAYGASKAALIQLTKYYAKLLAPIRVNAVSPGGILQGHSDDFINKYSKRVPLKRMANPEEIVSVMLFLLSPAASYITGQNIMVDGGLSI